MQRDFNLRNFDGFWSSSVIKLTLVDGVLHIVRPALVGHAQSNPQDGPLHHLVQVHVGLQILLVQEAIQRDNLGGDQLLPLLVDRVHREGYDRLEQTVLAVDGLVRDVGEVVAHNVQALVELAERDEHALLEATLHYGCGRVENWAGMEKKS